MLDETRRRPVPWLLYCIGVQFCAMLGLNIWGTIQLHANRISENSSCDPSENGSWTAVAEAIVYGSWAALGFVILVRASAPMSTAFHICSVLPLPTAHLCSPPNCPHLMLTRSFSGEDMTRALPTSLGRHMLQAGGLPHLQPVPQPLQP